MSRLDWFRERNGISWSRVLLVTLFCSLLVALGVFGSVSTTAFGPYNPSWDGATDLRNQVTSDTQIESEFVSDTARYQEVNPDRTVAFVIAPDEEYEGVAIENIQQFVDNGGTLVVLENFGESGNALLRAIGADTRFDGDILRDELNHYEAPTMPVATEVTNHSRTEDVDQLTLNYATAVQPGNATILVRTSNNAYLVDDPDVELTDETELMSYPVATIEDVDDGVVIAVGDPSITINAMLTQPDNAVFLENLYDQEERVLFDISHNEGLPPLTKAVLTFRESALLQVLISGIGIVVLALLSRRRLLPHVRRLLTRLPGMGQKRSAGHRYDRTEPILNNEERAEFLRRQHPEWDEDRIQRVIAALNKGESKRDDTLDK